MKSNGIGRQIAVMLFFLGMIAVNVLANALPINGLTTGEISDSFDILFVPAGYVFSIWGLIYLGVGAYAVYQLLPAQRQNSRLRRISRWFILTTVANSIWIVFWHYGFLSLSVLAMLTLLASLLRIYTLLEVNKKDVNSAEKFAVHVPFQIFLGWITVATIANISTLLYDAGWNGFGLSPAFWTLFMLGAGLLIAYLMARYRGDIPYLLVLVWAFAGIGVSQAGLPVVAGAAWVAAALVAAMVVWLLVTAPRRRPLLVTT